MIEIKHCNKEQVDPAVLQDFTLDLPTTDLACSRTPLTVMGWIVGRLLRFRNIVVCTNGEVVTSVPVDMRRPDVAQLFPGNPAGDELGFCAYLNPLMFETCFHLEVWGIREDGEAFQLYQIEGQRQPIRREDTMRIKPLLLTTLGRTGSTLLVAYLSAHPEISVYRPMEAEARYLSYWMEMFFNLSAPKSWMQPLDANDRLDPAWIFGKMSTPGIHFMLYPEMFSWFYQEYLPSFLSFCLKSLDGHYQHTARVLEKNEASLFCEKTLPDGLTDRTRELIPESKEIFLVRDFRDMFCSIRAFNRKRGFLGFSREHFENDMDYIRLSLAPSATKLLSGWKGRGNSSFLLKYEDLIFRREKTMKEIFAYLEIESSSSRMEQVMTKGEEIGAMSKDTHMTVFNAKSSIGRYKTDLEPELLAFCNEMFEQPLKSFGYEIKGSQ